MRTLFATIAALTVGLAVAAPLARAGTLAVQWSHNEGGRTQGNQWGNHGGGYGQGGYRQSQDYGHWGGRWAPGGYRVALPPAYRGHGRHHWRAAPPAYVQDGYRNHGFPAPPRPYYGHGGW